MATTYSVSQEVVSVTTMNLRAGDTIQTGNCIHGYWTYVIQEIAPSPRNKYKMAVTILFSHGGTFTKDEGKTTRWSVVKSI